jgi:hypothetical protein
MGDDEKDEERWLPPSSDNPASTPPPGAPDQGETRWGAPAPPPAPGQPTFYPAAQAQGSEGLGKATTAMVLGILGLLVCPVILSVLALVFGYDARKTIDNSGGRYNNRGSATAAIVCGWIGIALGIVSIIYIVIVASSPDDDDNGIPDGLENASAMPFLGAAVRLASVAVF